MAIQNSIVSAENYLQAILTSEGCRLKEYPDKTTGEMRKSLYLNVDQGKAEKLSELLEELRGTNNYVKLKVGNTLLNMIAISVSKFDNTKFAAIFTKPTEAKRFSISEAINYFEQQIHVEIPINEEELF